MSKKRRNWAAIAGYIAGGAALAFLSAVALLSLFGAVREDAAATAQASYDEAAAIVSEQMWYAGVEQGCVATLGYVRGTVDEYVLEWCHQMVEAGKSIDAYEAWRMLSAPTPEPGVSG